MTHISIPAETRIGRGENFFFAGQRQFILRTIELTLADRRKFMRQPNLRKPVLGRPGRHHRCTQAVAVLSQAADGAQAGAKGGADDHQRDQHLEQGKAASRALATASVCRAGAAPSRCRDMRPASGARRRRSHRLSCLRTVPSVTPIKQGDPP